MNMTRRDAVIKMALLLGASVVGPRLLGKNFGLATPLDYTADEIALLDEIGETIIPGARAEGIGGFIAMMVADCYATPAQQSFKAGLARLPAEYRARCGEEFVGGQLANRTQFLNELYAEERKERRKTEGKETPSHYFRMLRELTVLGYFSSETGQTKTLRYLEMPGRYDGDVPYKKGDEWFI